MKPRSLATPPAHHLDPRHPPWASRYSTPYLSGSMPNGIVGSALLVLLGLLALASGQTINSQLQAASYSLKTSSVVLGGAQAVHLLSAAVRL